MGPQNHGLKSGEVTHRRGDLQPATSHVICDITSFEELLSLKRKSSIDSVHSKRVRSYLSSHQLRCQNTHRVNRSLRDVGKTYVT